MITEELIDRLVEATNEAKATVRELHEARRDAKLALSELDEKVAIIRKEVLEGAKELIRCHVNRIMDEIHVKDMAAGLKSTFDEWLKLLGEATEMMAKLHARDDELKALVLALRKGVR